MTIPSKTARSVGETLRHAREDQNLTLSQVAQTLHIRTRFLELLEANDIKALPSLTQSRGFLRLYAEYLGLDPQPLLAKWQPVEKLVEKQLEPDTFPISPYERLKSRIRDLIQRLTRPTPLNPVLSKPVETAMEPPRSEQLFKAIGKRLQRQREELGMSYEEVALFSHIKVPTLQLLETMDMKELPSPVIVRGLLVNYAEAIKLDSEQLLFQFADALQARRDERTAASQKPKSAASQMADFAPLVSINLGWLKKIDIKSIGTRVFERFPFLRKYVTFDLLAGGLLLLVLITVVIWAAASTLSLSAERIASLATLPGRSDILASGSTLSTGFSATPSETSTVIGNQSTGSVGGGAGAGGQPGAVTYLVTLPADADAAFRVSIQPLQTAFVQIWVDDRIAFRGRMSPGAFYPFNATRRVELLTGDASALRIFFNSTDLGILGISGEVVHTVYTVRGAQTITPTVTTTFTPTPRPSATPLPSATRRPTSTRLPTATPRPSATIRP